MECAPGPARCGCSGSCRPGNPVRPNKSSRSRRPCSWNEAKRSAKPNRTRNRRHIQDHAAAIGFHGGNRSLHAVVVTLHIHAKHPVEICFRGSSRPCQCAKPRHCCQPGIDSGPFADQPGEGFLTSFWSVTSQAQADALPPTRNNPAGKSLPAAPETDIQDPHRGTRSRQTSRQSPRPMPLPAPVTRATLPSSLRLVSPCRLTQSETPLFHGMKSFCAFSSAFVLVSPLATLITNSRISSPMRSMVVSPGNYAAGIDINNVIHAPRQG